MVIWSKLWYLNIQPIIQLSIQLPPGTIPGATNPGATPGCHHAAPAVPPQPCRPGGLGPCGSLRASGVHVLGRARHRGLRHHGGHGHLGDLPRLGEEVGTGDLAKAKERHAGPRWMEISMEVVSSGKLY